MAVFEYRAMDHAAGQTAGTVVADSPAQARSLLRGRGLTVLRVAETRPRRPISLARKTSRSREEVTAFIRELSVLLRAGIPLLAALEALAEQHGRRLRAVIQHLADQVAAGVNLAAAMAQRDGYFDSLATSIVAVGESSGALDVALGRLADFREKASRLSSRLTTALIYPAIVLAMGTAVAIFLMTYVVPSLLGTLTQAGRQLPTVTLAVKNASDLLRNWWWAILLAIAAIAVATRAALAVEGGRLAAHRLILKIPLIGPLAAKENVSRMAVVLAALLRSGLPFVDAVRITRGTIRNKVFAAALADYEKAVTAGADVAESLKRSGVFNPMVIAMLAVGQKTGELEAMLEQLGEAYDQQIAVATARLVAMLEPLLIVLMAVLVGFIAFATILPILEMSNVLT